MSAVHILQLAVAARAGQQNGEVFFSPTNLSVKKRFTATMREQRHTRQKM